MSAPNLTAHAGGAPTPVVSLKHDSPVWKSRTNPPASQVRADWDAAVVAGLLVVSLVGELTIFGAFIWQVTR